MNPNTNWYENSLVNALNEIITNQYCNLLDFTIICNGNVPIQSYKILLAARSKYFEAAFRQEPQTTCATLDFEVSVMKFIIESLVYIDLSHLEVPYLLQLLEAADYLQMDDLMNEVQTHLSKLLNLNNIYDVIENTEMLQAPCLKEKYYYFVKQNLLHLTLDRIPISVLKILPSISSCHIKDLNGRFSDPNESEVRLFEALTNFNPHEDWNFSETTKKKIWFTIHDQDLLSGQKSYDITADLVSRILEQISFSPQSLLYESQIFKKQMSVCSQMKKKLFKSLPFGKGCMDGSWSYPEWSVEGVFRKIGVKTRYWEGHHIVQGLKITMDDGSRHAFGMEFNEDNNVVEFEIPRGQHIKEVILKSGLYIDQIGFVTNDNVQFGPVGGDEGGDAKNVHSIQSHYNHVKDWYLHGINGITVQTNRGSIVSCSIAQLQFVFTVIPEFQNQEWLNTFYCPIQKNYAKN